MEKIAVKGESEAFSLSEYGRSLPKSAVRKDLMSYLGEYRYQVFENNYTLVYRDGHLRDIDRDELMIQIANRTLRKRLQNGRSTHREQAEYEGIAYLDKILQNSRIGDRIIWLSPPGPKDENYGDYGFIYEGEVCESDEDERKIEMSAYRVERNDIKSYNEIIHEVIGYEMFYKDEEDFLAHPLLIHFPARSVRQVLMEKYNSDLQNNDKFKLAMQLLNPLVEEFTDAVRLGSPKDELKRIFYAIENLALHIKEGTLDMNYYSLAHEISKNSAGIIMSFGSHRAPFTAGSCGGTDKEETNVFGSDNFIRKLLGEDKDSDQYGSLEFECPVCHHTHRRIKDQLIEYCPDTRDENGLLIPIPKC